MVAQWFRDQVRKDRADSYKHKPTPREAPAAPAPAAEAVHRDEKNWEIKACPHCGKEFKNPPLHILGCASLRVEGAIWRGQTRDRTAQSEVELGQERCNRCQVPLSKNKTKNRG